MDIKGFNPNKPVLVQAFLTVRPNHVKKSDSMLADGVLYGYTDDTVVAAPAVLWTNKSKDLKKERKIPFRSNVVAFVTGAVFAAHNEFTFTIKSPLLVEEAAHQADIPALLTTRSPVLLHNNIALAVAMPSLSQRATFYWRAVVNVKGAWLTENERAGFIQYFCNTCSQRTCECDAPQICGIQPQVTIEEISLSGSNEFINAKLKRTALESMLHDTPANIEKRFYADGKQEMSQVRTELLTAAQSLIADLAGPAYVRVSMQIKQDEEETDLACTIYDAYPL